MMIHLTEELQGIHTVAIAGHVRPDGDCAGSCLAAYNYIREQFPNLTVHVYLEPIPNVFWFLKGAEDIRNVCQEEKEYDLFLALDSGDRERLGDAVKYFDTAKKTICVDHHISNQGYAQVNYIVPEASSTSELIYGCMEEDKISSAVAECIYLGIVHDTGVFQYSCTSPVTMDIAGKLMGKGIDFTKIIEDTFYKKTYGQNRILGKALLDSYLILDGKGIVSCLSCEDLKQFGVTPKDLDGIVSQLRVTTGVEVAIFLYETQEGAYKVSMRSTGSLNVSRIASNFGGGGHVKAAGCTMQGSVAEVVEKLSLQIEEQLQELLG